MNFLVTGGAGFIGSHVCERLLIEGHRVWTLDDLNDFYDPQIKRQNLAALQALKRPFEFVPGDLTNTNAVNGLFRPFDLTRSSIWPPAPGCAQAWNSPLFTSA